LRFELTDALQECIDVVVHGRPLNPGSQLACISMTWVKCLCAALRHIGQHPP
jgi:hypothetical protein